MNTTKNKILRTLRKLQQNNCRSDKNLSFCRCILGGKDIDSGYFYGKEKGCAELKFCIQVIKTMSPEEFKVQMKKYALCQSS